MRFSRWQAAGNIYLLTDGPVDADAVRAVAGDGDGVLQIVSSGADVAEVVIWNPDGSRAEMSGNGTRIVACWLGQQTGARSVTVRVASREVVCRLLDDGRVEQDLGEVVVHEPERIAGLDVIPVSVGNPHAVVIGDPTDLPLIGPLLETHPRFPERTNVQVARVDGPGDLSARVWERGVGETASSGTSAVAVAAAAHGEGEVTVHFPGGDLEVRVENGRAVLTGPARRLRVPRQVLVYLHRPGADGRPRFLLLRRIPSSGGFWQGVSGAPEWGESDEDAAVREVQEEVGLDVSTTVRARDHRYELTPSEHERAEWERLYGPGVGSVPEEVYSAEVPPDWEPALSWEHDQHRWCELQEALSLLSWHNNREALRITAAALGD